MKKLIAFFLVGLLVACSGISIKPDDKILTTLQMSSISTTGYLIAKNNPDYIPGFMDWYSDFLALEELASIQDKYKAGISELSKLMTDDPFLQMQIKNAMNMLEIAVEGPTCLDELDRYREIVDYFMLGVASASS